MRLLAQHTPLKPPQVSFGRLKEDKDTEAQKNRILARRCWGHLQF